MLHPVGRDYTLGNADPVHSTDNFVRLAVDLNTLKVEVFARKGEQLGKMKMHTF